MTDDVRAVLAAPFPWFGGKSRVARAVWRRFGAVRNYVEPFFGSGAVLLGRPRPFAGTETVNDVNGWITNAWRSIQFSPDETARHADWPVSELDLHARGDCLFYSDRWYAGRGHESVAAFIEWLRADPMRHDPLIAGWYLWGLCAWIGTGWGPRKSGEVNRQLPHLGDAGQGVNRKRPHLGNAGRGVNRKRPADRGRALRRYLRALSVRLRGVRVCCGDWTRVLGPTPTVGQGLTAVFLDPPYGVADRADCYDAAEDRTVSARVREWALAHGDDPRMRIALCGYEGEHQMPASWECLAWKAMGGYASQSTRHDNPNARRERCWFSPHCLRPLKTGDLFDPRLREGEP